jgi:hypothetical protein
VPGEPFPSHSMAVRFIAFPREVSGHWLADRLPPHLFDSNYVLSIRPVEYGSVQNIRQGCGISASVSTRYLPTTADLECFFPHRFFVWESVKTANR